MAVIKLVLLCLMSLAVAGSVSDFAGILYILWIFKEYSVKILKIFLSPLVIPLPLILNRVDERKARLCPLIGPLLTSEAESKEKHNIWDLMPYS